MAKYLNAVHACLQIVKFSMPWIRPLFKDAIYGQLFIFIGLEVTYSTPVFTILVEIGYLS